MATGTVSSTSTSTTASTGLLDLTRCSLAPLLSQDSLLSRKEDSSNKYTIHSFYVDGSGRASVSLPLSLQFPSKANLQYFLQYSDELKRKNSDDGCTSEDSVGTANKGKENPANEFPISIEAKVTLTSSSGEAVAASVESVNVSFSDAKVVEESSSVIFDADILVRVSHLDNRLKSQDRLGTPTSEPQEAETKVTFEVYAISRSISVVVSAATNANLNKVNVMSSLQRMHLGGQTASKHAGNSWFDSYGGAQTTRTSSFTLQTSLTKAFSIQTSTWTGPEMGQTFMALTIRHSGSHSEDIVVTNIALHPSHSIEYTERSADGHSGTLENERVVDELAVSSRQILDMSKIVQEQTRYRYCFQIGKASPWLHP